MNPFVPFCLYIAARVLIQYVAMQPHDDDAKSSVKFLLSAIAVMKPTNPLADSFLVQLDVELEGIGFEAPAKKTRSYAGKQQCMVSHPCYQPRISVLRNSRRQLSPMMAHAFCPLLVVSII